MPLNKLENFIKNTEGRILYVNPNDLDATDGIENQGNSLTKPFKTVQRALIESARFSYLRGNDNDITEKTTILLFPGEHVIDNRPGFAIKDVGGVATAVSPGGTESFAGSVLDLTLNSNFDLTQENNVLYKFNSIYGGVIVPRGTSIVGLDLRKTKVRAKYVPNPTDPAVNGTAIFKITGACYFWQFSIFDANESGLVYTDPSNFSITNQSKPTFSHHKLTCFEYADGVNLPSGYSITDLDMYYSKVGNAFNRASGREIDQKYPAQPESFKRQRPEWEIVGAFAADPVQISTIISGDGATPGPVVTVTTQVPHGFTAGTPIKVRGIQPNDYNISTKVSQVVSATVFTYLLSDVRPNLPAGPAGGLRTGANSTVTIETDTVSGASPYIFNISLRSVWGMQGMHADGAKASGFRSMVVAQFTGVSLQKDDRAFVKYNPTSQKYDNISISKKIGEALSSESSSKNEDTVYHLSPDAIYRNGWQSSHVKMSNDAIIQIVSVFAIGYTKHFDALSGGDASITNSNSNFGQVSLAADGFKAEAFDKDNKGYITSIVTPRSIDNVDSEIEWVQFDVDKTKSVGISNHLYLFGYKNIDVPPPIVSQGYRIGAKRGDNVYVRTVAGAGTSEAAILMTNGPVTSGSPVITGTDSSAKVYSTSLRNVSISGTNESIYKILGGHNLKNGESIRIFSETGDLPEGLEENVVYYAVTSDKKGSINTDEIQIASSRTNAVSQTPLVITSYGGSQLRIESRVSDKSAGELGHPVQWDSNQNQWFIHTSPNSVLYQHIQTLATPETEISFVLRTEDSRSLDEKIYKIRYVVPKELTNGRAPSEGFIFQDSSSTTVREDTDFGLTTLSNSDYLYNRNPKFITTCTFNSGTSTVTIRSDSTHNLKLNDKIIVKNVVSTTNPTGQDNIGYNGTFIVDGIANDKTFTYGTTDIFGVTHNPGTFTGNINVRTKNLPRFRISDNNQNIYAYRIETITPYVYNIQDGVYYIYTLNASVGVTTEFTNFKYTQKVADLYPQQDRDNHNDNPDASKTFAKRFPLGDVSTNDLKRSLTRETVDLLLNTWSVGKKISGVSNSPTTATLSFDGEHQLNAIKSYTTLNGGSGHSNGTYYNVRLFNNNAAPASAVWDGATANVTVSGGAVTSATIVEGGSGYTDGEQLYFDSSTIGGTPQANILVNTSGISTATNNYVQITGIGTTAGGYFRITDASNKSAISIAKTANDPACIVNQYAVVIGPAVTIQQTHYSSTTGIATYQSLSLPHGLLAGNAFRILDNNNNNLGDFIVRNVGGVNEFSAKVNQSLTTARWLLKHGTSANSASADNLGENLGVRSLNIFDNEILLLGSAITTGEDLVVDLPGAGIGTVSRFPLGSYIQIDSEIMRVKSSTLSGTGTNEIKVIRGSMGTIIETHSAGSLIKKIKLLPIEFRRPSILRASGHTFEYLGYGPGNYSTGLPQVQVKTLSEKEEFLAQSQETSCGNILYTGMNSDGDFYIGNTKYSAQSGEQTTFEIPTPTITGEDPSRLSVVFDEVIVKERILVEGGNSGTILSQFDGPVTFNGDIRMNSQLVVNDNIRVSGHVEIKNTTDSTNCLTGALIVAGGVGISKRLNVCGISSFNDNVRITGITTISGLLDANGGAEIDNIRIGIAGDNEIDTSTGNLTIDSAGGTTTIDDILSVSGNTTFTSTTANTIGNVNTGSVQLDGGAGIAGNLTVGGDFDVDGATTLDNVSIDGTLNVTGNVDFDSNLTVDGSITIPGSSNNITAPGGIFGNIRIAVTGDNEIDTSSGNLTLDSAGGTTTIDDNLSVSGQISASGDVIAFVSDERLKTNIQPLENALDKVLQLSGFTYTFNEIAESLGFNTEDTHVGVSAQQVQVVLPEAVKPAPVSGDYITVQYEKIVPLLIEAIKELSAKVDALEKKIG